jgi:predicted RNA-binding Zn ribbon-like protein
VFIPVEEDGSARHTAGVNTEEPSRAEAPGDLELVRAFVNTLDIEAGTDDLGTSASSAAWLEGRGWPMRIGQADRDELVRVREGLRDLVSTRGTPGELSAMEAVDTIGRRYPLVVRFSSASALSPSARGGTAAFIERILGLVAAARIDGSWKRMKTCANDRCRWLFYDHSRNRSRTWCTMDLCGSQSKMRAYRRRHAPHPAT